jgi:formylglycine-generating enzyme required for sulfatase activity/tRNA A-37 threonylcarbamoyl transferase component Bud32
MTSNRFQKLRELFERASTLNPVARQAVLDEARSDDPELGRELDELLRRDAEGKESLEDAVGALAAKAIAPPPRPAISDAIVARLAGRGAPHERYRVDGEFARGGMGVILEVWDEDLHRPLAMKVQLPRERAENEPDRSLGRFLEEAQVTGQLEHPGIVPVHELGTTAEGNVYFTMKLVRGRDLMEVLRLVPSGTEGWSAARVVRVIHRVCEAMAYAHDKGVIHRDLKPANVMVGRFGEVYVMDWGLARVDATEPGTESEPQPYSEMRSDPTPDGIQMTQEGDILGTPSYMPPEQAYRRFGEVGPKADVYAVGAILYHLLAGHAPYLERGVRMSAVEIVTGLIAGPPRPLHERAPDAPPELVSICEKAMERDPAERYTGMLELAADLEAWIEGRVVHAYETGAWAEARKWVLRNRGLAASLAAAIVIAIGGLGAFSYSEAEGRQKADAERRIAVRERNNVLRLSAVQKLVELERRAEDLWPAEPELLGEMDTWLRDARELVAGLDPNPADPNDRGHRLQLAELRELADPDDESRWWTAQLEQLVTRIEAFADDETGLAGHGVSSEHEAWGVARRRAWADTIRARSLESAEAERLWFDAGESIANPGLCPQYGGFFLDPQLGLLPIGQDPDSGLWEFAHLQSGEVPERDTGGRIVVTPEMAIVLVLIPGGSFEMGAQSANPAAPNYDPRATAREAPIHTVDISPFFLSKYEMTQAQWLRMYGTNPGATPQHTTTLTHPVQGISWLSCRSKLERVLLRMPSESEWEYAARAGTRTTWWTGNDRDALKGAVNLADQSARRDGATWSAIEAWPELDDGHRVHAPVGTFRASPFGLHEVYGNVAELCTDNWAREAYRSVSRSGRVTDPVLRFAEVTPESWVVIRGGSFSQSHAAAASAIRNSATAAFAGDWLGVRPVRPVLREPE